MLCDKPDRTDLFLISDGSELSARLSRNFQSGAVL
jgi:hypothetical protein